MGNLSYKCGLSLSFDLIDIKSLALIKITKLESISDGVGRRQSIHGTIWTGLDAFKFFT